MIINLIYDVTPSDYINMVRGCIRVDNIRNW